MTDEGNLAAGPSPSAEERRSMLLPLVILANLFGDDGLDVIAAAGNLTRAELEREVAAIGSPLRKLPEAAVEWFQEWFEPVAVPGTDPVEYEVLVPLWTDAGMAARAARARLVPTGFESMYARKVVGFEDVTPPPEVANLPPDPERRPEPPEHDPEGPLVAMENPIPQRWQPVLRDVVDRLVAGDYGGLERDGVIFDVDGPGDMVKRNIEAYHDSLVALPPDAFKWSDHLPPYGGPGVYSVTLSLWTAVEGVSDLTLTGEIHDDGEDIRLTVSSVHVL